MGKKVRLKVGTELTHKKQGSPFRVTAIEYEVVGQLPGDSIPRQMYMNKKELLFYFDIKTEDEDLFG